MIQAQIQSLARTPNPITLENLPSAQTYLIHHALQEIEKYYRFEQKMYYPPLDPEPYELPPDIEERLDQSKKFLPPDVFKKCIFSFLINLKHFPPKKENLLEGLATALEPEKYYSKFPSKKTNRQVSPWRDISPQPIPEPSPKPKKTELTLKKKTTARGQKWRLDPRWDKLTPCAKAVFLVLCLRAIWPKKPNQWPWAFAGVGTWIKGKGEIQSKLSKQTGFKSAQLRRALRHLQALGMIKKIIRGSTGQGVSKFHVFFTPEMSKAYTAFTKNKNRTPNQKKKAPMMT